MAAEVTIAAPLLLLLLVFIAVLVHRGVTARLRLTDAAHQAARAASIERTPSAADAAARRTATAALSTAGVSCASPAVATDTAAMRPGGTITVTVSCTVEVTDALLPGIRAPKQLAATAVEPVDTWRFMPAAGSGS